MHVHHSLHVLVIPAGFQPPILDMSVLDEIITVQTKDAIAMARRLAQEEGIFAGISSGAAVAAALRVGPLSPESERDSQIPCLLTQSVTRSSIYLDSLLTSQRYHQGCASAWSESIYSSHANRWQRVQVAERGENRGKLIVTLLPSFGERYLSTPLFQEYADAAARLPVTRLPPQGEIARIIYRNKYVSVFFIFIISYIYFLLIHNTQSFYNTYSRLHKCLILF